MCTPDTMLYSIKGSLIPLPSSPAEQMQAEHGTTSGTVISSQQQPATNILQHLEDGLCAHSAFNHLISATSGRQTPSHL